MYLSTKEHDQLRNIVMGFEVPFRTFIARRITSKYHTAEDFINVMQLIELPTGLPALYSSEFGRIKADYERYYKLLVDTVHSCALGYVPQEVSVPNLSALITLYLLFGNEIGDFLSVFPDYMVFASQLERYKYVRNKLDHPQSKTLQTEDMYPVLSFIKEANMAIFICDEESYWDKKQDEIEDEILALETKTRLTPIECNNFSIIPFLDSSIVCRQHEIELVKTFVYGSPGALKKKTSLCIFGYGGVGKTAIVTEAIKVIVRDVIDSNTVNGYIPRFILFFSAKTTRLDYSHTSGSLIEKGVTSDFSTCKELEEGIYRYLKINSFVGFEDEGVIIIDNLETIESSEREAIRDFVNNRSPKNIQYIITSRNEEPYDERLSVNGFLGESGIRFIDAYIDENSLMVDLDSEQKEELLNASRGNTLVLVLALQRLDKRIVSVPGIVKDLSQCTPNSISKEIADVPLNGYEIVSEFMFKNTFEELKVLYEDKGEKLDTLLRVFAVYPSNAIDVFTICMITEFGYQEVVPIMDLLCKYLILERKEERYNLNPFAEKYIVQKLLPDAIESERMSSAIEKSITEIRHDLSKLQNDLNDNEKVRSIIDDWSIDYDGDRIAAAKIYKIYSEVNESCQKGDRFHVESSYDEFCKTMKKIESTTMHPYIKYQKARILQLFYQTKILKESVSFEDISRTYTECIWAIKANALYSNIMTTKTYASILWIYALFLDSENRRREGIKYLEDAQRYFESIRCRDIEYYQCICKLARLYIDEYKESGDDIFIERATPIGSILWNNRGEYGGDKTTKHNATLVNNELNTIKNIRKKRLILPSKMQL